MNRAAFLDRDGVINIDHAYVHRWEDFHFVDDALAAAKILYDAGYQLIITTNQSGIGRGYYSVDDFWRLHRHIDEAFRCAGAPLTGVYFCPHHPEKAVGEFKMQCQCRKPNPGMILQACDEHNIAPEKSLFFGDKRSDMQAALAANIPTRVLLGTNGTFLPEPVQESTLCAKNLLDALCHLGLAQTKIATP